MSFVEESLNGHLLHDVQERILIVSDNKKGPDRFLMFQHFQINGQTG